MAEAVKQVLTGAALGIGAAARAAILAAHEWKATLAKLDVILAERPRGEG